MKLFRILPFLIFFILSCKAQLTPPKEESSTAFQEVLDKAVADDALNLSGISMSLVAPDLDINWSGASGYDSTDKDQKLDASQPFRIASITKSFVAAALLRLHEEGRLNINDPIANYISEEHQNILKSDTYEPGEILLKHCLQHTSGLFDYAMGSNAFVEAALENPQKRWSRTEQLQFAMDHGDKLAAPGAQFSYSDTGYILLGAIIENITKKQLAEALKDLLKFEELGLSSTWLESLEPRPKGLPDPVHRYFGEMDATSWDNSIDLYGGGGLSSTTMDLANFFSALFNGKVFRKEATLQLMLEPTDSVGSNGEESGYGMGLWQIEVDKIKGYMHDGFWGTAWAYLPKYNCAIAINYTNDTQGAGLIKKTIDILKKRSSAKK